MAKDVRKLIIIPEYRPLFAMRKCYGPPHGPLTEPCPTPISVIGELVAQKPPYALTVMEVVREGRGFSKPVRLTPDNYMLPYAEIVEGKVKDEPVKVTPVTPDRKEVVPETITPGKSTLEPKHKVRDLSDTVYASVGVDVITQEQETPAAPPAEEPIAEAASTPDAPAVVDIPAVPEPVDVAVEVAPEAAPPAEEIPDKYAGMSKAERKAARRAEREAAQQNT